MKTFAKHALCSLLVVVGTSFVAACSDDDEIASTVDPKQWNLDQNMDTSVKPGDDFARYCWGKWYDNAGTPTTQALGSIPESSVLTKEKLSTLNDYELNQLYLDASRLNENDSEKAALQQHIAYLKTLLHDPDTKEVAKAFGEFLAAGRLSFIQCKMRGMEGTINFYISKDTTSIADVLQGVPSETCMESWLVELGLTPEEAADVAEKGLKASSLTDDSPVTAEEGVMEAFCEPLGADEERVGNTWDDNVDVDDYIATNDEALVRMMICSEAADLLLVSRSALDKYLEDTEQNEQTLLKSATDYLLSYPRSKEYVEKYVTAEMRQIVLDMMENVRTAFAQRLDKLTWMSSTTKQAAKNKLAAMKFNACYPDQWISAGLPQLTGESLYGDMQIIRQAKINLKKELYKLDPRDYAFSVILDYYPTYTVNCVYDLDTNTAHIFAPMVTTPFYSPENSDATLYAVGCILGHEITHAFDNNGSKYGVNGEKTDWWTVSDKQDFESRTQLLIDCYNHLPAYMGCAPHVYQNGTITLSENIADLGGLEAALQAYNTKLAEQGYRGDELVKQQKRFFQAYANIWRSKYSEARNLNLWKGTNAHANEYARVLGTTMNCDKWYEVYGVQWGDKYYLRPEKRTHIW